MTANVRRRAACSTASFAEVPGATCSSRALTGSLPTPRGTDRRQEGAHSASNRVPATGRRGACHPPVAGIRGAWRRTTTRTPSAPPFARRSARESRPARPASPPEPPSSASTSGTAGTGTSTPTLRARARPESDLGDLEGPGRREELVLAGHEQDLAGAGVLGALQEAEHRRCGAAEGLPGRAGVEPVGQEQGRDRVAGAVHRDSQPRGAHPVVPPAF